MSRIVGATLGCCLSAAILGCASSSTFKPPPLRGAPLDCALRVVLPASSVERAPGELRVDTLNIARALHQVLVAANRVTALTVVAGKTIAPVDGADLELRVESRSRPMFAFARRTGWFIPNTLLWFFGGFPSFWVADRAYRIEWDVELVFLCAATGEQLASTELSLRHESTLSIVDRGWTAAVLYTPPGFYEGPATAAALEPQVENWLVSELTAQLATHAGRLRSGVEIEFVAPANGETIATSVRSGPSLLHAIVRSPVVLERLRIELDGVSIYEKDPLTMIKAVRTAPGGRCEYDVYLPLRAGAGEHLLRACALRQNETASGPDGSGAMWSATRSIRFTVPEPR